MRQNCNEQIISVRFQFHRNDHHIEYYIVRRSPTYTTVHDCIIVEIILFCALYNRFFVYSIELVKSLHLHRVRVYRFVMNISKNGISFIKARYFLHRVDKSISSSWNLMHLRKSSLEHIIAYLCFLPSSLPLWKIVVFLPLWNSLHSLRQYPGRYMWSLFH